jgi:hypothetical protein
MRQKWNSIDRQNFADRNILKSARIPSRRRPGPSPDEWEEMSTENLEQRLKDVHRIANDLADRLISLGHHQDPTVRAWHRHIMTKKEQK